MSHPSYQSHEEHCVAPPPPAAFPVENLIPVHHLRFTMMAVCPKCDVALVLLEFSGVEIDYCPRCEGLWVDRGEIEQLLIRTGGNHTEPLVEFIEAPARTETGRPAYLCPRCDRQLKEVVRAGEDRRELRVDRCPRGDGIWFDKNELHLLLRSLPHDASAHGAIAVLSEVLGCYIEEDTIGR